jgi:branched-subunit amino acid aminotransferase/4-amino-4-deoxychorismate lyase
MQDLTDADEIFLTSSSLGVAPVTTFDFRRYSSEGTLTTTVARAFEKIKDEFMNIN